MTRTKRWEPCVYHRGTHAETFLRTYLEQGDRSLLIIAGAGFDPRSVRLLSLLPDELRQTARVILIREERPNPALELVERANRNRDQLVKAFPKAEEHPIQIFARDNAIVGGREGAKLVSTQPLTGVTDIFVDMSALSIGVGFPIIRHFIDFLASGHDGVNLHVTASHNPQIDEAVSSNPSDTVAPIHGFRGGWGLDEKSRAAILWMPQLARGKTGVLNRIFQMLRNVQDDTVVCPILPFPSSRPRLPDELIEEFSDELGERAWSVDVRDLVYADEKSPLDLYRTILRIDEARRRVFQSVGGSQIILSPLGSKALSLGALMAALERDEFTILHVEAIGYTLDGPRADAVTASDELVHIWLCGDAYGSHDGKEAERK